MQHNHNIQLNKHDFEKINQPVFTTCWIALKWLVVLSLGHKMLLLSCQSFSLFISMTLLSLIDLCVFEKMYLHTFYKSAAEHSPFSPFNLCLYFFFFPLTVWSAFFPSFICMCMWDNVVLNLLNFWLSFRNKQGTRKRMGNSKRLGVKIEGDNSGHYHDQHACGFSFPLLSSPSPAVQFYWMNSRCLYNTSVVGSSLQ